jgi:hypothetical protein
MNSDTEAAFEAIAEEAIRSAEQVKCSQEDFAEGLKLIESEVRNRKNGVLDEIGDDE